MNMQDFASLGRANYEVGLIMKRKLLQSCSINKSHILGSMFRFIVSSAFCFFFVWHFACFSLDEAKTTEPINSLAEPQEYSITYRSPLPLNMTEAQEAMNRRFKTPNHLVSIYLSSRRFEALIDENVPTGKVTMNTDTYLSLNVSDAVEDRTLVGLKATREILIDDSLEDGIVSFSSRIVEDMLLSKIGFYFYSPKKQNEMDYLTFSYCDELQDNEAYFDKSQLGETFSFTDPSPLYRLEDNTTDLYDFSKLFPTSFQYKEIDKNSADYADVCLSPITYQRLLDNAPFYNRWIVKACEDNVDEIKKAKEDIRFDVRSENNRQPAFFPKNTATSLFLFWGGVYSFSFAFALTLWQLFASISHRYDNWGDDVRTYMREGRKISIFKKNCLETILPTLLAFLLIMPIAPTEIYWLSRLNDNNFYGLILVPYWEKVYMGIFVLMLIQIIAGLLYFVFSYKEKKLVFGVRGISA